MWLFHSLFSWWSQSDPSAQEEKEHEKSWDSQGSRAGDSSSPTSSSIAGGSIVDLDDDLGASFEGWHNRPMWRNPEPAPRADGRTVERLKGFFRLAQEELDKAVRAEESKQPGEAVAKYKSAHLILSEALATAPADDYLSSEAQEIKKKILRWKGIAVERMNLLSGQSASSAQRLSRPAAPSANVQRLSKPVTPRATVNPPARALKPATTVQPSKKQTSSPERKARAKSASVNSEELRSKGVDPAMVTIIENDILDRSPAVQWADVAGLAKAKQALWEMVILPTVRSDIFQGLRKPARGLLLFGPPGNGKTMIAKAVATEAAATFFSISASTLTAKYVGESEKLVRALFAVAAAKQPSVIFIDEIDSLLSSRGANEHEASRRLKTEFLVQFDGVMTHEDDRIIVMGATNRPQDLDEAVRRRLVKRIYVPLPDSDARLAIFINLLKGVSSEVTAGRGLERLVDDTEGYSGSDIRALCQEAAMIPIRELGNRLTTISADEVRPVVYSDFREAMKAIRPSVSRDQLHNYEKWNAEYGSS